MVRKWNATLNIEDYDLRGNRLKIEKGDIE
jgi:hypothetical protein